MLRFLSIATLAFYLVISIGVHINVDLCCSSVASVGLSPMEKTIDHGDDDGCCAIESIKKSSCCASEEKNDEHGCDVDGLFIQVLAEEQAVFPLPKIQASETIALALVHTEQNKRLNVTSQIEESRNTQFEAPPPWASYHDDLYLVYQQFCTYG